MSTTPRKESMLVKGRKLATRVTKTVQEGKVNDELRKQAVKIQAEWRKIVTGSANKRIRDHLKETQQQPQYVKFFDKVAFTFGVLNIATCQYFLLNVPEYFPIWYSVVVPLMMLSRLYHFRSLNWQYFMLDFCYFVLACTLTNISVLRWSPAFFKVCFIFATGALPVAVPIWRNSLIFHDYDKIVSVYIHILPCCLYYALRWHEDSTGAQCLSAAKDCPPLLLIDYLRAIFVYLFWQTMYIMKTEVWDRPKLDRNPEILTSLRWLAKDTKNASARAVLKILKRIGIFRADEEYDSTTLKTKLVFVTSQLTITVLSFLPSYFVYRWQSVHLLFIGLIFTVAVFNGASFYIEVFSVRYHAYIDQLEQMRGIAKAASEVVHEIAALTGSQENGLVKGLHSGSGSRPASRPASRSVSRINTPTREVCVTPLPDPSLADAADTVDDVVEEEEKETSPLSTLLLDPLLPSEDSPVQLTLPTNLAGSSLEQISSELQRTEAEVWDQMREHAQAFYACTSPAIRSQQEHSPMAEYEDNVEDELQSVSSLGFAEDVDN